MNRLFECHTCGCLHTPDFGADGPFFCVGCGAVVTYYHEPPAGDGQNESAAGEDAPAPDRPFNQTSYFDSLPWYVRQGMRR